MRAQDQTREVARHLKRVIRREGFTLGTLSEELFGKAPDWLSKVLRGQRPLRLEDLFMALAAVGVTPAEFFAEIYDLYRADDLGAEFAPGVFEGPIRRFVETVARRVVVREARAGRGRSLSSEEEPSEGTGMVEDLGQEAQDGR